MGAAPPVAVVILDNVKSEPDSLAGRSGDEAGEVGGGHGAAEDSDATAYPHHRGSGGQRHELLGTPAHLPEARLCTWHEKGQARAHLVLGHAP
eukprot:1975259-Prymnesium_polylepis.2